MFYKKLLVVVDMQNDFITGSLGSTPAHKIVGKVCDKIRSWDGEVCYTMDTHFGQFYRDTIEGRDLPVEHCVYETDGWNLNSEVLAALMDKMRESFCDADKRLAKTCFGSTRLGSKVKYIAEEAQESDDEVLVELVGLCTDVCVLSNAVIARNQMPNVRVVVDASCCAGTTRRAHRIALEAMKNCGIQVTNEATDDEE